MLERKMNEKRTKIFPFIHSTVEPKKSKVMLRKSLSVAISCLFIYFFGLLIILYQVVTILVMKVRKDDPVAVEFLNQ